MKNKLIYLCLLGICFSPSTNAEFNLFGKKTEKEEPIKTEEKEESIGDLSNVKKYDNEEDYEILTEEEQEDKKRQELVKLKSQKLEDFIKRMEPAEREKYISTLREISEIKEKRKYNKKEFIHFIEKDEKFIDVSVPFQQIIHINFDQVVAKLEAPSNKNLRIDIDSETAKKITLENRDLFLEQTLKITFLDGTIKNFLLNYGKVASDRHTIYKFFMGKTKLEILPEFKKKLSIRNVHSYFNNISTKLILDKLLKKQSFKVIEENKKVVRKTLFKGTSVVENIYGKEKFNYEMILDTVYETPFVKDTKEDTTIKKRLVLLELKIRNLESKKMLTITPEFIKKRFSNYTAMYLGNLEYNENKITPNETKNFLVVIEDTFIDNN